MGEEIEGKQNKTAHNTWFPWSASIEIAPFGYKIFTTVTSLYIHRCSAISLLPDYPTNTFFILKLEGKPFRAGERVCQSIASSNTISIFYELSIFNHEWKGFHVLPAFCFHFHFVFVFEVLELMWFEFIMKSKFKRNETVTEREREIEENSSKFLKSTRKAYLQS